MYSRKGVDKMYESTYRDKKGRIRTKHFIDIDSALEHQKKVTVSSIRELKRR